VGSVPIEIDQRWRWSDEELSSAADGRTSPLSKREVKEFGGWVDKSII
jgi:hypothetical protein